MLDYRSVFDNCGTKRVSTTDITKRAYVPSQEQKDALAAAGYYPVAGGGGGANLDFRILFDPTHQTLDCSYYNPQRKGSGRTPETRIGRDLLDWVVTGDVLVIGNIGKAVYVTKGTVGLSPADTGRELAKKLPRDRLRDLALLAKGPPKRQSRRVADFARNPYVIAAALQRANGICEMPGCTRAPFYRTDGSVFLEVHHIVPLAEGGDDTLRNVAALCPACHRELHFGVLRLTKRARLDAYVGSLPT